MSQGSGLIRASSFPRAVVLWVRLRPDLEERCFEYWMFYRPDLGFNQSLAKECARRIDSLVNDGPDGPYTWTWIDDRYQVILVERGVITPEGELQLHPRGMTPMYARPELKPDRWPLKPSSPTVRPRR